jgi:hypothetical protein
VVVSSLALAGCGAVMTADAERLGLASAEFRGYVEAVFREQNRVADALAFALEAPGGAPPALEVAEQRLQDACAGVNELATLRRDGARVGPRRGLALARTVPECERAAREADAVLRAD